MQSMDNGKLKLYLQSFASFSVAHRIIMALWKARSPRRSLKYLLLKNNLKITPFRARIVEFVLVPKGAKGLRLTGVFSSTISTNMASFMEVFEGGSLKMKVMEKVGCQKYLGTQWESDEANEYQLQIHYKLARNCLPLEK